MTMTLRWKTILLIEKKNNVIFHPDLIAIFSRVTHIHIHIHTNAQKQIHTSARNKLFSAMMNKCFQISKIVWMSVNVFSTTICEFICSLHDVVYPLNLFTLSTLSSV